MAMAHTMNDNTSPYTTQNVMPGVLCHTGRTEARVVATAGHGPQYQMQLINQGGREQTSAPNPLPSLGH